MKLRIFFVCLYCIGVGSAQMQNNRPVSTPGSQAEVAGIVLNDLTGKPLDHVHIRLLSFIENSPSAVYGAMSDVTGHFSISGVAPATYLVMLDRTGFITVAGPKNSRVSKGMLAVKAGGQLRDLTLRMTPQPIISGRVSNEYGDPMMGVSVSAVPLGSQTMIDILHDGSSQTNDRGEFRLVTPPGRYYIKASSRYSSGGASEIRTDGTVESSYVDTYYPGATAEAQSTSVEAKPGRELRNINIQLARTPVLTISGRVVNIPDGVHSIQLELNSGPNPHRVNSGSGMAMTDPGKPDGKFQYGHLGPGFYRLSASCFGDGRQFRSRTVEFNLTDSNYEDVELALAPGAEVAGVVEWAGSLSGKKPPSEKLTVRLHDATNSSDYMQAIAGDTDDNGAFKLMDVFAERYTVEVDPMPENSFVKSVQMDGTPVADGILDFTGGAEGVHLKIILSPNGGRISGRVRDENGEIVTAFAQVLLVPHKSPARGEVRFSKPTSEGVYKFSGLPPGNYRLFAQGLTTPERNIDEMIDAQWDKAPVIEIKEGQNISKDLKVIGDEERNGPSN